MKSLHAIKPIIPEDMLNAAANLYAYYFLRRFRIMNGKLEYWGGNSNWVSINAIDYINTNNNTTKNRAAAAAGFESIS